MPRHLLLQQGVLPEALLRVISKKKGMKLPLLWLLLIFSITSDAQLNPLVIGAIHHGDSIVIKYDVTINNPLVPPNASSISNQGTISGGNFSNVLTDDPDTGPTSDATITLLNLFPLPVILTELKAYLSGNQITLKWEVATEHNLLRYEIERSPDGYSFTKIDEVIARNSSAASEYTYTDVHPINGNNYYRLRTIDIDGVNKHSSIVKVKVGSTMQELNIFPNPVSGHSVNIQMQNMAVGAYSIKLFNLYGQVIFSKVFTHPGATATEIIYFPETVSNGLYQLEIGNSTTRKIFKLLIL